jgi:hypothetical protein
LISDPVLNWDDILLWGEFDLKGHSLKASLCKLSLGAVVYNVGRHRNDIKHSNPIKTEDRIVKKIVWEVRTGIMS